MPNLLVEIGTEELPLSALDVIYRELEQKAIFVFTERKLDVGQVFAEATPRRIALYVEDMASKQADQVLEISGPKWEQAFDGDKPTKALLGFLKAKGAKLENVTANETPRGKFVLVKKKEKGKPVQAVLPELLEEIFKSLNFPKMMKWDASGFRFPRPIRWIVAVLDKKPFSFQLADIKSSTTSYGHRFLSPKSFKITKADWKGYWNLLKKHHVFISLEKRKDIIRRALTTTYKQKKIDEELVHITAQLVEEPFFLEGSFDRAYLALPAEVLATCMKKNQKIFACYASAGKLQNKFVAVLNGKRNGLPRIRFDYENVLESRLKDARYFFEADTKEKLESKLPLIEQITYLGKLGTMKDKTERLERFSPTFAELSGHPEFKDSLKQVSRLAKIDLMTQLVFEFPELQGIVGREYALAGGAKKEVALAIGTQYQPSNLTEKYQVLPKSITVLGALYGIMDRLDLLVGAFGTGIEPTGSQDPFALRRAGGVLIKLLRAFDFRFSLQEAIQKNIKLYGDVLDKDPEERLLKFLSDRVAFELRVKPGTRTMEIFQAVWNASHDNLGDLFDRFDVLNKLAIREPEKFRQAVKVVERTGNIAKQDASGKGEIQSELLTEPQEKKLYELVKSQSSKIESSIQKHRYEEATLLFGATFYEPVHDFFEQVMVNVEDTAIRSNRQALMKRINHLYTTKLADLSVLSRLDEK